MPCLQGVTSFCFGLVKPQNATEKVRLPEATLPNTEVEVRHLKRVCVWGRQLPAVLALGIITAGSHDLTEQRKILF